MAPLIKVSDVSDGAVERNSVISNAVVAIHPGVTSLDKSGSKIQHSPNMVVPNCNQNPPVNIFVHTTPRQIEDETRPFVKREYFLFCRHLVVLGVPAFAKNYATPADGTVTVGNCPDLKSIESAAKSDLINLTSENESSGSASNSPGPPKGESQSPENSENTESNIVNPATDLGLSLHFSTIKQFVYQYQIFNLFFRFLDFFIVFSIFFHILGHVQNRHLTSGPR